MDVGTVALGHLVYDAREHRGSGEDVRVFCKEAEDQSSHEVVHVRPARGGGPIRILTQKLDVQLVETAGGPNVDRIVLDLPDRGDSGQRQEEAEVVGKLRQLTGDGVTRGQFLGL